MNKLEINRLFETIITLLFQVFQPEAWNKEKTLIIIFSFFSIKCIFCYTKIEHFLIY